MFTIYARLVFGDFSDVYLQVVQREILVQYASARDEDTAGVMLVAGSVVESEAFRAHSMLVVSWERKVTMTASNHTTSSQSDQDKHQDNHATTEMNTIPKVQILGKHPACENAAEICNNTRQTMPKSEPFSRKSLIHNNHERP